MTASEIAKLREETGAGVMDCKNALEEAKGNFEEAKKILAGNAAAIAKKKAERATKHGLIETYVHSGRIGVMLELASESDFVAKNAEFKELAHQVAMQIASMSPKNIDELLKQEFIMDSKMTIEDLINSKIAKIRENIKVNRFVRYELGEEEGRE
ncbi:TPA: translation elongation factor Ts [Candidatus Berkelbacteria bacterium]|uniref:Elongation factor Ts n=1 Tax=Berkelbacteria bacterium GW2011_GWE1_39_12 TaxID=1618337 RepID=A0A0G4B2C2_9BACT|nr:MAG: Translation elongation factor EFTs/EF1B dimerization, elongation factor Ts [Berkelbacteria bacterium GW2011_GWE1_39_12]HBO60603.1 translation elongation factor Ts [Candidatus Berkelbacteria bacterium]